MRVWPIVPAGALVFLANLICLGLCIALYLLQPKKGQKLPPLPVWVVDLDNMSWTSLVTTGDIPTARGGHSVSRERTSSTAILVATT